MQNIMKSNSYVFRSLLIPIMLGLFMGACTTRPTKTTETPSVVPSSTPRPTQTKNVPTKTPTEVQRTLVITTFHDLNGNEFLDDGEPPVAGVRITEEKTQETCISDQEGICDPGSFFSGYRHFIIDVSEASVSGLNYIFDNKQVFTISDGRYADIGPDETRGVLIALGQGPLPIPMIADQGYGGIYSGSNPLTTPANNGLDIWIEGDGEKIILANIGGTVQSIDYDCNRVGISVDQNGLEFEINFEHLTRLNVEVGQEIEKGDGIGFIDPTLYEGTRESPGTKVVSCTTQPHLHYDILGPGEAGVAGDGDWIDPLVLAPESGNPKPLFVNEEQAVLFSSQFIIRPWFP